MLHSEPRRDLSRNAIMFDYLSDEAKAQALAFMNAQSAYELHWDVIPLAQLPGGTIGDYTQADIDLQALSQLGCYRRILF